MNEDLTFIFDSLLRGWLLIPWIVSLLVAIVSLLSYNNIFIMGLLLFISIIGCIVSFSLFLCFLFWTKDNKELRKKILFSKKVEVG
jgi:hypothetical protein